jgi:HEAT repeat protein
MAQVPPFSTVIEALLDEANPFPPRYLHRFSDLSPTDLKSILVVWPRVSAKRKLNLLEDLEDLSDADTLVSFEDLARPLLSDLEAGIRIRAIHLLWECQDVKLASIYIKMLNNDKDNEVRSAAASALGSFIERGELEEIPGKILHQVEQNLLSAVKTGASDQIRMRALEALGASSQAEVAELIDTAYHRNKSDWTISALHAMGRSCDERWEKYVLAHLFDQQDDIRSEAVRAAGKLGLSSARAMLLDLLEDEDDPEMRREAVWALSSIGGEGIREKLEELLTIEEDEEETDFLEEALENLLFNEDLDQFDLLEIDTDEEGDEKE